MSRKVRLDGQGNELPSYIYWNKRFRRYEVRAYINGKEVPCKPQWYTSLDKAIAGQKAFIAKHEGKGDSDEESRSSRQ